MPRARFTEQDVGAIIQRATELHEQAVGRGDGGLDAQDIERIAAEMGIPAEHVRRAILERDAYRPEQHQRWFSRPTVRERVAIHGPLDDDRWDDVVQRLRRHFGGPGEVEQVGEVRYWSRSVIDMGSELSRTEVTAVPHGDDAHVELHTRIPGVAFMAYFFAFIIFAGIVGVIQDGTGIPDALMFLFAGLGGLAGAAGVHGVLTAWTRSRERGFRVLMSDLTGPARAREPIGGLEPDLGVSAPNRSSRLDGYADGPQPERADPADRSGDPRRPADRRRGR